MGNSCTSTTVIVCSLAASPNHLLPQFTCQSNGCNSADRLITFPSAQICIVGCISAGTTSSERLLLMVYLFSLPRKPDGSKLKNKIHTFFLLDPYYSVLLIEHLLPKYLLPSIHPTPILPLNRFSIMGTDY